MAYTKSLLIAVPCTLLSSVTATGASATFALPSRSCVLTWQTSFNSNPDAVNITIRVSIDGVVWTVLDTSTAVGGEVRTITAPTAAVFVDANVVTNTGVKQITVVLIAKVAVP